MSEDDVKQWIASDKAKLASADVSIFETVVSPRACTTGIEFSSCGGAGDRCSFAWDSKGQLFIGAHFCVPKAATVRGIARLLSNGTLALVAGTSASDGSVSDGVTATAAYFPSIPQILFDKAGNLLASVSAANNVRRIDAATHRVMTLVGDGDAGYRGDDVEARLAALNHPRAIAIDGSGTLHIADDANDAVRSVWQIGDTVASTAQMVFPSGSGESQFIHSPLPGPLSVTMKDGSNRDLPGVEVTWRSHTPGAGIIDAPSPSRSLVSKTDLAGKSMMRGRLGRALDSRRGRLHEDLRGVHGRVAVACLRPPSGSGCSPGCQSGSSRSPVGDLDGDGRAESRSFRMRVVVLLPDGERLARRDQASGLGRAPSARAGGHRPGLRACGEARGGDGREGGSRSGSRGSSGLGISADTGSEEPEPLPMGSARSAGKSSSIPLRGPSRGLGTRTSSKRALRRAASPCEGYR